MHRSQLCLYRSLFCELYRARLQLLASRSASVEAACPLAATLYVTRIAVITIRGQRNVCHLANRLGRLKLARLTLCIVLSDVQMESGKEEAPFCENLASASRIQRSVSLLQGQSRTVVQVVSGIANCRNCASSFNASRGVNRSRSRLCKRRRNC